MQKKFITLLKFIATELIDGKVFFDYHDMSGNILDVAINESDLPDLHNDLLDLEGMNIMSDEEIDILKSFLSYVMFSKTRLDWEEVYNMIFGKGKVVIWH